MKWKKWIKRAVFALLGGLSGYAYYHWVGCASGGCAITSNPVNSVLYMALIGFLVSGIFEKGCDSCNT